jgi:hypothetical protein
MEKDLTHKLMTFGQSSFFASWLGPFLGRAGFVERLMLDPSKDHTYVLDKACNEGCMLLLTAASEPASRIGNWWAQYHEKYFIIHHAPDLGPDCLFRYALIGGKR